MRMLGGRVIGRGTESVLCGTFLRPMHGAYIWGGP